MNSPGKFFRAIVFAQAWRKHGARCRARPIRNHNTRPVKDILKASKMFSNSLKGLLNAFQRPLKSFLKACVRSSKGALCLVAGTLRKSGLK